MELKELKELKELNHEVNHGVKGVIINYSIIHNS